MIKKIVLWYDTIEQPNCVYKDAVHSTLWFNSKLKNYQIEYVVKDICEEIDIADINLYPIEIKNDNLVGDSLSLISKNTFALFEKGLSILFYYPSEGHELGQWFENIYNKLLEHDLINYSIYFVFGDYDFIKNYNHFILKKCIPSFIKPIYLDYFLSHYYEDVNSSNDSLNLDRAYDFLCYNGKLRSHRLLFVSELKARGLLKNNLVSFADSSHTGRSHSFKSCLDMLEKINYCPDHVYDFVNTFNPIILDIQKQDFSMKNQNLTNKDHYKNSFFSVVSESRMTTRFLTEKTYKPIYNLHPFMIISAPGILKILKSKGFETFPELFDENYDNETDHVKRLNMILVEIEKFTNLSFREKQKRFDSIKHKLIYNKQHYINLAKVSGKSEYLKLFKQIEKYNTGQFKDES